jgi:hypothetical protein
VRRRAREEECRTAEEARVSARIPQTRLEHFCRVVRVGCLLDGGPAEIAHAHGPSLTARGFLKTKGRKQIWQDWLVLPLCPAHHRLFADSLDNAMSSWEQQHGTQAAWLDLLCDKLQYNVWDLARETQRWKARHPKAPSSAAWRAAAEAVSRRT